MCVRTARSVVPSHLRSGAERGISCIVAVIAAKPHGHFLAGEAGELAGVSGTTIGQWARWGYIRASQSAGDPHVYSVEDVAEAAIVRVLLERGVRLRRPGVGPMLVRSGPIRSECVASASAEIAGAMRERAFGAPRWPGGEGGPILARSGPAGSDRTIGPPL